MESFKASLFNEIEKMYRKKKATLIVILSVGIIAFVQLISTAVRSGFGIIWNTSSVFPITVLSAFSNTILPLFTALVVIDAFTGEFSHNTMKIAVTKPVSRFKVYLSKLTATAFFVLINLLIVMILSTIAGVLFNADSMSFIGILRIFLSYIVTLVPIMAFAVIIAFFANIFKSSAIVFFVSIILFIVSNVLALVFSGSAGIFITSALDWYKLWIADFLPFGRILSQLALMAGYILIFFTAGYYKFDKRDL